METYEERINRTNLLDGTLKDYLDLSLKSDNKDLCRGWDFLRNNLIPDLKEILLNPEYQKIEYNSENVNFILKKINVFLEKDLKEQLGSFVYVWKDIKRELEKKNQEENLKKELLEEGFILNENLEEEELRKLDGLKVDCVMDLNKIGLLGSYDKTERLQGTFKFSDYNKGLMLIPKRSRTRGYMVGNKFYYKEI